MKKLILLPIGIVSVLLLSSCASVVTQEKKNVTDKQASAAIWQQRRQQLSKLNDWHMKGRMIVVNGVEFWSLSVDWQQKGEQYLIFLSGPFGAGKIQLVGSKNGVLLKNSDEQVFYAETPEELLLEHTGVVMPLRYLRYWMLGLPDPMAVNNNEKLDSRGRLESLRLASGDQLPWDIHFRRYISIDKKSAQSDASLDLPDKIFINQGDNIKVRVVVGEWLFDNSQELSASFQ